MPETRLWSGNFRCEHVEYNISPLEMQGSRRKIALQRDGDLSLTWGGLGCWLVSLLRWVRSAETAPEFSGQFDKAAVLGAKGPVFSVARAGGDGGSAGQGVDRQARVGVLGVVFRNDAAADALLDQGEDRWGVVRLKQNVGSKIHAAEELVGDDAHCGIALEENKGSLPKQVEMEGLPARE